MLGGLVHDCSAGQRSASAAQFPFTEEGALRSRNKSLETTPSRQYYSARNFSLKQFQVQQY